MTKANWELAPHDAETYEQDLAMGYKHFCKPGFYWGESDNKWFAKPKGMSWTILEHRPPIIAWEDMKEGMVVRCVEVKEDGNWYRIGELCDVSADEAGDFGPLNTCGDVTPCPDRYTFELVSEPEQDPQNWEVLIESPEGEGKGWTHTYNDDNCYIKVDELDQDGFFVVMTETDGYMLVEPADIKPIKPTITKEQFELLEKARQYFDIDPKDFAKFMNDYEVK